MLCALWNRRLWLRLVACSIHSLKTFTFSAGLQWLIFWSSLCYSSLLSMYLLVSLLSWGEPVLSSLPGVTSFLAPAVSIQTYLVAHGLHLRLSPLLAMCHCPHWARGNRTPTVQHCLASWDISAPGSAVPSLSSQDHCGCCPLEGSVSLSVSAKRASINAPLILLLGLSASLPARTDISYQLWWLLTSDPF